MISLRSLASLLALALLALATGALAAPDRAAATPGWLPPLAVEPEPSATALSFPRIIARPGGCSSVAFERGGSVHAANRPPGGSFATPQALGAIAPGKYPDAASGGEVAALAWDSGDAIAFSAASGCAVLPSPATVPGSLAFPEDPVAAVDGGGRTVLAFQAGGSGSRLIHVSEAPAGGSPGPASPLPLAAGKEGFRPQAAAKGTHAAVVFDVVDGGSQVYGSRRTGPGSWSAPVRLTAADKAAVAGSARVVAGPDGALHAVWVDSGNKDVVLATLDPAGAVVRATLISGATVREPAIAVDGAGRLAVIWADQAAGGQARIYGKFREPGGSFSPQRNVSATTSEFRGNPRVAIDAAGRTIATWSAVAAPGATQQVFAATRAPGSDFFAAQSPPLSVPGKFTTPSDISTDAAGNTLVALFVTSTPREAEVLAFDAAPPLLADLSIAAAGTAGQPLAYSVSARDAWSPPPSVQWTFGDGGTAGGAEVVHAFPAAGAFPVQVAVADARGNSALATGSTAISPAPAPVTPGGPGRGTSGRPEVSRLTLFPRRLIAATQRRCLRVRFTLSAPATARFRLERRLQRRWRLVRGARGSFPAGGVSYCLRAAVHTLPPGRYRIRVVAVGREGSRAPARSVGLTIAPR